jgi:hypothetical protein
MIKKDKKAMFKLNNLIIELQQPMCKMRAVTPVITAVIVKQLLNKWMAICKRTTHGLL